MTMAGWVGITQAFNKGTTRQAMGIEGSRRAQPISYVTELVTCLKLSS